jgi:hypothetical protein
MEDFASLRAKVGSGAAMNVGKFYMMKFCTATRYAGLVPDHRGGVAHAPGSVCPFG